MNELQAFVDQYLDQETYDQLRQSIEQILQETTDQEIDHGESKESSDSQQSGSNSSDNTQQLEDLFVHPNVRIESAKGKGRYFVAKDLIEAKTLIVREKPLSVVFLREYVFEYCDFCHKRVGDQFFPCSLCTEVVYCSPDCGRRALNDYHRYECGFVGLLFRREPVNLQLFRLMAPIGSKTFVDCYLEVTQNGFDFSEYLRKELNNQTNKEDKSKERMVEKFKFFTSLEEHTEKEMNPDFNILDSFNGLVITLLLKYSNALDDQIISDFDALVSFVDIVCRYLSRIRTNVFGWYTSEWKYLANCVCLYSSLINHSCEPNIDWHFNETSIFFVTDREIKPGEEINNTYGFTESSPLIHRQESLEGKYYFQCRCQACKRCIGTVTSLRCPKCEGPVLYDSENEPKNCFECFHSCPELQSVAEKVEIYSEIFKSSLTEVCKSEKKEEAIEVSQSALISNLKLVHKLSPDLLTQIRQFISICHHFSLTERAVKLSKHLLPAIEYYLTGDQSMVSTQIVSDLLLLTRIHYKHLTESGSTDSSQWRTGLEIYSKTIQLLRKLKYRLLVDKGQPDLLMGQCYRLLKDQFQELSHIYAQMTTSGANQSGSPSMQEDNPPKDQVLNRPQEVKSTEDSKVESESRPFSTSDS